MIDIEKCRITHYPADVLARPARPIEKIDDNIRRLVEKMTDIMLENKGVGLAAPQAGVSLRIFIISLDVAKPPPSCDKSQSAKTGPPTTVREKVKVYINPTVTAFGELDSIEEACLSVPGVYTKVSRYKKYRVTATDLDGNEFTEEAEGLYARCLQHENDHINGLTIADRMGSAARIVHRKQLKKLVEEHEKKRKT